MSTRPTVPPVTTAGTKVLASAGRGRRAMVAITLVALSVTGVTLLALLLTDAGNDDSTTLRPGDAVHQVAIDLDAGNVIAVAGEELVVSVERSTGRFLRGGSSNAEVEGGALRVTEECPVFTFGSCQTDVTVALPAGVGIAVSTGAGSIDVSDATGGVDLQTAAGPIRVRDLGGDVRLRTHAGNISGTVLQGEIDATTAAGSITLTVVGELSGLAAATDAGNVELIVPEAAYVVDASTSLGRTNVEVPTFSNARRSIEARSGIGDVAVTFGTGSGE